MVRNLLNNFSQQINNSIFNIEILNKNIFFNLIKKHYFKLIFCLLFTWYIYSIIQFELLFLNNNNLYDYINQNNFIKAKFYFIITPLWITLIFLNIINFFKNYLFDLTFLNNIPYNSISIDILYLPTIKDILNYFNNDFYFNIDKVINIINLSWLNSEFINNYPLFLLFGLLFLITTVSSLIVLSYLGLYGVFIINFISIIMFWLSMIYYFDLIMSNNYTYYINLGKWMYLSSGYRVSFDLFIDVTSISFSFLTLTIGVFVYIYTFSYFRYEPLVERLMLLLNSFMISMILLVSSGNFIVMFLGWEMIGLTSFFLINFWSTRVGTLKAAFKAFSFNKLSDLFLFFAILLIFNTLFSLDILTFNSQIYLYENYNIEFGIFTFSLLELISFFFISCAFIKSAQFGAHIWLPDSMEAPVPASALIHSATLVSAGIYLLLRLTPLFELSKYAEIIIPFIGSITAFYGGIVSAFQSDTKKTLAFSNISHCGFLMVAYSTGVLEFVILYLYVHGFFKAATFLCMGNVNRFNRNIQDFKRMGGFYKYLPFECLASFVCMINLSGLPLSLGFYIKHLLFIGLNEHYILYWIIYVTLIVGATAGVFYSYRLFYSIFFDVKKGKKTIYMQANRVNLNSKYYTNTSLASNFAIFILIVVSYITTLYLYNLTLNKFYNLSDLKTLNLNNGYSYYYQPDLNFLNTVSILNWFVIILIIAVIFVNWRITYYYNQSLNNFNNFIIFSLFFFIISKFIL